MMSCNDLGSRMKVYEKATQQMLPENLPVIIRLDGRCFHKLTKKFNKPFDLKFIKFMNKIALNLCRNEVQNVKLAYVQSDEISLLLYKDVLSQSWFGNKIQKMVSLASARASSYGNSINDSTANMLVMFDARAFILPPKEVCNYFIWRQKDWTRNSVQMYARSLYPHNSLQYKNQNDMKDMIFKKGFNWNDLGTHLKRGRCVYSIQEKVNGVDRKRWVIDNDIPIFTEDRKFIERYLKVGEL